MQHVQFGRTGLKVSRLCLGTMTFGFQCNKEESFAILDYATDAGITFFDMADVYPVGAPREDMGLTEEIIGEWMGSRRDEFIVGTKCHYPTGPRPWDSGNSRKNIMRAVEASLRRLKTDYIDLYQVHSWDANTPIDETLQAMDDLVRTGKVRYVGCSNFLSYQLARSVGRAEFLRTVRFDSIQPRYNLLFRENERELFPLCAEEGIAVIPYNATAGGLLTGKHVPGPPPENTRFTLGTASGVYQERYWHNRMFDAIERMKPLADEAGLSLAQMSVAWILRNPVITAPIVGASIPSQLDDAIAAVDVVLDDDLMAKLHELTWEFRFGDNQR